MNTRVRTAGTLSSFALAFVLLLSAQASSQEQLFKLVPSGEAAGGQFGYSVSISGDRAIVGADLDTSAGISSWSDRI